MKILDARSSYPACPPDLGATDVAMDHSIEIAGKAGHYKALVWRQILAC